MNRAILSDEKFASAVKEGRRRMAVEFRASAIRYDAERDVLEVSMADGWGLVLMRRDIKSLANLPVAAMSELCLTPVGTGILLDAYDVNINVHGLVSSLISPHLMASTLGRKGGAANSEAKKKSSRENGKKGGRPRRAA
jgi:hypothetical protein